LSLPDSKARGGLKSGQPTCPPGGLRFWAFWVAPTPTSRKESQSTQTIEDVVRGVHKLGRLDVRVRGRFRGRNLFSEDSCEGAPADGWVLRDGPFWIWVTGRKPQGDGWSLDPRRLDDAHRWLEVTGRAELRDECVVVKASEVALASGPEGEP
jgi:hypothetical protein